MVRILAGFQQAFGFSNAFEKLIHIGREWLDSHDDIGNRGACKRRLRKAGGCRYQEPCTKKLHQKII